MDNTQKPVQSDEIDLGQLLAKIGEFFKNISLGFLRFIALIRQVPLQNRLLFGVVLITALGLVSVYGLLLKKKFYESSMILSSYYINSRTLESIVDKLNQLAAEENRLGLSRLLNIPAETAKDIVKFEAKPFIEQNELVELELLKEKLRNAGDKKQDEATVNQVISRIEIENRHSFEIKVRSYSPNVFTGLQKALIDYFRNNEYVSKRIEINKTNLQGRKVKLLAESKKLDSLKVVIYSNYKNMAEQSRQGSNNVILSDRSVTNPLDVYNQDLSLHSEIQEIDRLLYIQPDFEVVDGFTEFTEPASASLPLMLAQAFAVAIGLSYLIVALREFNNYLAKLA